MRFLFAPAFIALCFLPAVATAQDSKPAELVPAYQRLDEIYRQILEMLPPAGQEKLKNTQRAWIAFRDLECKWAYDQDRLDCLIERTEERADQLEQTPFTDADGEYGSLDETAESEED